MKIIWVELFYFNQEKLTLDFSITPSSLFMGIIFNPALFGCQSLRWPCFSSQKRRKLRTNYPFPTFWVFLKLKSAVIGFHHFNIIPNILTIRIVFPLHGGGFRIGVLSFHCRVSKSLTNHRGVGNGQTNPWSPCLEKNEWMFTPPLEKQHSSSSIRMWW